MNKYAETMKKFFVFVLCFFPTKLPIGMSSFDDYTKNLFATYGIPNLPSYKSAVATAIMHLGHTKFFVTRFYFYLILRKAQANEIAFAYLDEQRIEQGKKLRAEKQAAEDARVAVLNANKNPGSNSVGTGEAVTNANQVQA